MPTEERISSYLKFLPAIYQQDAGTVAGSLINRILLACEKMLSGIEDDVPSVTCGIEKMLDNAYQYFDPANTPEDFLEWLAGWVALDLIKGKEWNDDAVSDFVLHIRQLIVFINDDCLSNTYCDVSSISWIMQKILELKTLDNADLSSIDQICKELSEFETSEALENSAEPEWIFWWLTGKLNSLPTSSRNRTLIRKLVPLYYARGTRYGFEQTLLAYLKYLDCTFVINEMLYPFQIGKSSVIANEKGKAISLAATHEITAAAEKTTLNDLIDLGNKSELTSVIGCSTVVGEGAPYYFRVNATTNTPIRPTTLQKKKKIIAPFINQEKPAHTYYSLKITAPGMRIGEIENNHIKRRHCTIGVDTLIGGLTI
jgi:hypothetical protein